MKAGITGHQDLGDHATIAWVKGTLARLVVDHKISEGFTCLAKGADQLFAEILTEKDLPFIAIIPSLDYEMAFDDQTAKNDYFRLVKIAKKIIRLDFPQPSEQAFLAGGRKVVECSDLIFAVWNGKSAAGMGGTGDVVHVSKQEGKPVVHINPLTQTTAIL